MRRLDRSGAVHPNWKGDKATFRSIHSTLNNRYPKTGRCEQCGVEGPTDYAFLRHPEPHTRNRDDYRELCRSCHQKFDQPVVQRFGERRAA
jgi:hypothetical protein